MRNLLWTVLLAPALAWAGDPDDGSAAADTEPPKAVPEGQVTPDSPHYDLELLYHEHENDEGLKAAKAALAANPDDPDLYWHVARFLFEQGEVVDRTSATMDKKALYSEMAKVAEDGLKIDPGNPHLLFAKGVAKGRLGTTRGVLSSLFMAKDIEQSWLTAADSGYRYRSIDGEETLPCDAHLALGIFYRIVPDWWIVKVLSGTRGDLRKALSHLIQADTCNPGDVGTVKELGVTQLCIGTKDGDESMLEKGKATLRRIEGLPEVSPTEKIDHKHAKMLIDDPSLACEYSRDGQQDLDPDKLPADGASE